jgi:hypothetical protein
MLGAVKQARKRLSLLRPHAAVLASAVVRAHHQVTGRNLACGEFNLLIDIKDGPRLIAS